MHAGGAVPIRCGQRRGLGGLRQAGEGAGLDHPFIAGFARAMNDEGVATLRFNFPYMEAGRRSTDTPAVAVAAIEAAFEQASGRARSEPVWASGKSFGGRMASMAVAEGLPAAGLVFLGYPLHAPGRTDRVRDEHLDTIPVPMLFLHGSDDPFALPDLIGATVRRLGRRAKLHEVVGGDHSFNVKGDRKDTRDVGASLAPIAAAFMRKKL